MQYLSQLKLWKSAGYIENPHKSPTSKSHMLLPMFMKSALASPWIHAADPNYTHGQIECLPPIAQDSPIWSMFVLWLSAQLCEVEHISLSVLPGSSSMHAYEYPPMIAVVKPEKASATAWHLASVFWASNHVLVGWQHHQCKHTIHYIAHNTLCSTRSTIWHTIHYTAHDPIHSIQLTI